MMKYNNGYYLPHHAVIRPESQTTKLRTVFNASFKTSNGLSLNDILMTGPIVQDDLIAILMRFRLRRYVFSADITKMYRQIRMHDADSNLQKIFWRNLPEEPLSVYKLTTVTYGTSSASYLATKCLELLAENCKQTFPLANDALQDFYMDGCMSGADTQSFLKEKCNQLNSVMSSACLELHKWQSNATKAISHNEAIYSIGNIKVIRPNGPVGSINSFGKNVDESVVGDKN